ncbi:hypothetical protein SAMN05216303_1011325 [Rhodoferax sp. OV413]|uniref:hypothetical protein n=1 Tax=Rhodoferax sp. OV413 TaxID=1855285 RepID=UPI000887D40D|nr:hypothetical protein [Rhodoferax sp. OV413]SDO40102.1 hypothetical protein SAMN05216303_1011325 [Rhodoferax sp. OV413]
MLVFLDTEFTGFGKKPDLISLALAADDGRELYVERNDYAAEGCSDFVRENVLPQLGRVAGAACSRVELAFRIHAWLQALPEPAIVIFDYSGDGVLLTETLAMKGDQLVPSKVAEMRLLGRTTINHPVFEHAQAGIYTDGLLPHHALADARALRAGYREWVKFKEPIWRIR